MVKYIYAVLTAVAEASYQWSIIGSNLDESTQCPSALQNFGLLNQLGNELVGFVSALSMLILSQLLPLIVRLRPAILCLFMFTHGMD